MGARVPSAGWVGMGISASGGMFGSDMALAQQVNGELVVTDRFANATALPEVDENQDIELFDWQQREGETHFAFCRPLRNCDIKDIDIVGPEVRMFTVVYAFGLDHELSYHGQRRGLISVPLLDPQPPAGRRYTEPDNTVHSVNFTMPTVAVPPGSSYHCAALSYLGPEVHIIGQTAFEDSGLAHHMVLYACPSPLNVTGPFLCGVDMQCSLLYMGWSVGTADLWFPQEAGLPLGGTSNTHFLLEMHYENPAGLELTDASTLSLIYTTQRRASEVGLLILGTHMSELDIKPEQAAVEYVNECPAACTTNAFPPQGLKTIMITSHMHSTGSRAWVSHVRDGIELPELYRNDWFSPDYVNVHQVDYTLLPGDRLINHCVFDTRGRTDVTRGGLAADEEMCWSVLFYYPKIDLEICMDATGLMTQNGLPLRSAYCAAGELGRTTEGGDGAGVKLSFDSITLTQEPAPITNPLPLSCKYKVNVEEEESEEEVEEAQQTKPDYIIVGAGTVGLALARRLSDDPSVHVLVLDEGALLSNETLETVAVPRNTFETWQIAQATQRLYMEPSQFMLNRRVEVLRATGLGGSTQINGGLWSRMHPKEFDAWNVEGWSSSEEDTGRFMRKVEGTPFGNGTIPIIKGDQQTFAPHFLEAVRQAGFPVVEDSDFATSSIGDGFSTVHRTIKDGIRASSLSAYIADVVDRPNLEIIPSSTVSKILFDDSEEWAIGVDFILGGNSLRRYATREVILCAGVFGSPKLLMLSGIGPQEALEALDIKVRKDLPVGQQLRARPLAYVGNTGEVVAPEMDLNRLYSTESVRAFADNGTGPLSLGPAGALGAFKTLPDLEEADVHLEFTNTLPLFESPPSAFLLACIIIHPDSVGQVSLASADALQPPLISPNMYGSNKDLLTMMRCLREARRVLNQSAFDTIRGPEFSPGESVQSDFEMAGYVLASTSFAHHAFGTCRLGDVVDSQLRVRGFRNLRVVDASIVPSLSSGPMSLMYMLAEKAADLIARDSPPVPPLVSFRITFDEYVAISVRVVCTAMLIVPVILFILFRLRVLHLTRSVEANLVLAELRPAGPFFDAMAKAALVAGADAHFCLTFAHFSYYVKRPDNSRRILKNVCGNLKFGEMMAIMGPSGCGKSTLLETLAARRTSGTTTGYAHFRERASGFLIPKDNTAVGQAKVRNRVGFVSQQDDLPPGLSAFETLVFFAILKLPSGLPLSMKLARVEQGLKAVELWEHKDTKVKQRAGGSGLSGGQERRLSVAVQLLSLPQMIFLDEPTSGLDAATALSLVDSLRALALKQQMGILMTIHQPRPEVFRLFDQVMLLGQGQVLFHGDPLTMLQDMTEVVRENPDHCDPAIAHLVVADRQNLSADLVMDVFKDADLTEIAIQYYRSANQEAIQIALDDYRARIAQNQHRKGSRIRRMSMAASRAFKRRSRNSRSRPSAEITDTDGSGNRSRRSSARSTNRRFKNRRFPGIRDSATSVFGSDDDASVQGRSHLSSASVDRPSVSSLVPRSSTQKLVPTSTKQKSVATSTARTAILALRRSPMGGMEAVEPEPQPVKLEKITKAGFVGVMTVQFLRFSKHDLMYRASFVLITMICVPIFGAIFWQLGNTTMDQMGYRVMAFYICLVQMCTTCQIQMPSVHMPSTLKGFFRANLEGDIAVSEYHTFLLIRDTFYIVLSVLIFMLPCYFAWGLRGGLTNILEIVLVAQGLVMFTCSITVMWFSVFKKQMVVLACIGLYQLWNACFAGVVVAIDSLPPFLRGVPYFTPSYHAIGALARIELRDLEMACGQFDIPQVCSSGNFVLQRFQYDQVDITTSLFYLYGGHVLCRLVAYFAMRARSRTVLSHVEPDHRDLLEFDSQWDEDDEGDSRGSTGRRYNRLAPVLNVLEEEADAEDDKDESLAAVKARAHSVFAKVGLGRMASDVKQAPAEGGGDHPPQLVHASPSSHETLVTALSVSKQHRTHSTGNGNTGTPILPSLSVAQGKDIIVGSEEPRSKSLVGEEEEEEEPSFFRPREIRGMRRAPSEHALSSPGESGDADGGAGGADVGDGVRNRDNKGGGYGYIQSPRARMRPPSTPGSSILRNGLHLSPLQSPRHAHFPSRRSSLPQGVRADRKHQRFQSVGVPRNKRSSIVGFAQSIGSSLRESLSMQSSATPPLRESSLPSSEASQLRRLAMHGSSLRDVVRLVRSHRNSLISGGMGLSRHPSMLALAEHRPVDPVGVPIPRADLELQSLEGAE